jgi:hypothetical protein
MPLVSLFCSQFSWLFAYSVNNQKFETKKRLREELNIRYSTACNNICKAMLFLKKIYFRFYRLK